MKLFKDIFTGKNNNTYDIGRVLTFIFSMAYLIYPALAIYQGHDFQDQDWAIGAAVLLSGSGALLYLKKETEPDK